MDHARTSANFQFVTERQRTLLRGSTDAADRRVAQVCSDPMHAGGLPFTRVLCYLGVQLHELLTHMSEACRGLTIVGPLFVPDGRDTSGARPLQAHSLPRSPIFHQAGRVPSGTKPDKLPDDLLRPATSYDLFLERHRAGSRGPRPGGECLRSGRGERSWKPQRAFASSYSDAIGHAVVQRGGGVVFYCPRGSGNVTSMPARARNWSQCAMQTAIPRDILPTIRAKAGSLLATGRNRVLAELEATRAAAQRTARTLDAFAKDRWAEFETAQWVLDAIRSELERLDELLRTNLPETFRIRSMYAILISSSPGRSTRPMSEPKTPKRGTRDLYAERERLLVYLESYLERGRVVLSKKDPDTSPHEHDVPALHMAGKISNR
jgi:hypothetical protein